ncbi:MAG: hypothetical protein JNJ95_03700 [Dechloromonas sp.]|nr:hypothetical protein [Dechloromonas sp.]
MNERPAFQADFLNQSGINRQHVFSLDALPMDVLATLGTTDGYRQLILLGHGGRQLWERVKASNIGGDHPIDDYCRQTVSRWFSNDLPDRRYRLLYPGERPVGLQQLGTLAGWHHPSPFMVGIDGEWGSWFAYRAALLADTDFAPFLPVDRSSPCESCQEKPCIAACPAKALEGGNFSLQKCIGYRRSTGSKCQFTCLARVDCPVGEEHRYDDAQLRHSYGRSLDDLKKYR